MAIQLAQNINAEIISCDSMQVYKEMNIGTAKPSIKERNDIPHYMLDVVYPNEDFNVVKYIQMTKPIIDDIISRGKIPIIVGGTGLYVEALVYNIEFSECVIDHEYRNELEEISKREGNEKLYNELKTIDPNFASKISVNDKKRIIRGLEVYHQTGNTMTYYNNQSKRKESLYDFYLFGIVEDRKKLYERINSRIDSMLETGLVDEVKALYTKYNEFPTSMQGLGYKEVVAYLNNEYSYDEMVEKLKMDTRRYAKRQLTWFRRYSNMVWFDKENISIDNMISSIKNITGI